MHSETETHLACSGCCSENLCVSITPTFHQLASSQKFAVTGLGKEIREIGFYDQSRLSFRLSFARIIAAGLRGIPVTLISRKTLFPLLAFIPREWPRLTRFANSSWAKPSFDGKMMVHRKFFRSFSYEMLANKSSRKTEEWKEGAKKEKKNLMVYLTSRKILTIEIAKEIDPFLMHFGNCIINKHMDVSFRIFRS